MSLKSWWTFILGYVVILIQGEFPERFVNMAVTRGIFLWDITRLSEGKIEAKSRINAFRAMRHLARRSHCRVRIKRKSGLPFLVARLKRRKMLVLGGLFFLAALYLLSSFVWFVEITGTETLDPAEIQRLASELGLSPGTPKWRLDPPAIEKAISDRYPLLYYVHIHFNGTKAIIEVVEKVVVQPDAERMPAHLVAAKDGVIQEILVMVGQAQVKDGDTVKKGQILISGQILPEPPSLNPGAPAPAPAGPQLVHARGIVRARVWYQAYVEVPLIEIEEKLTGRTETGYYLEAGDYFLTIAGPDTSPYPAYQTDVWQKEYRIGGSRPVKVRLLKTKFKEMAVSQLEHTRAQAQELAQARALEQIKAALPPGGRISGQSSEVIATGDTHLVRVKVVVEALEEIGESQPIRQEVRSPQFGQNRRQSAR